MPNFLSSIGQALQQGAEAIQPGDTGTFLKAFLGRQLRKEDESGSFSIDPRSGAVDLRSNKGWGIGFNPLTKTVQGDFKIGGSDSSAGRSPEQALDEALGIQREVQESPINDWQDLWARRNPNYQ